MRITKKNSGRRARIQFYLSEEVERVLAENRAVAKKLGLKVDFQQAFRLWFLKENHEAKAQLSKLLEEKRQDGDIETD